MKKLLIGANNVKIRGYRSIPYNFAYELINMLYKDSPAKLVRFDKKLKSYMEDETYVNTVRFSGGLVSTLKTSAKSSNCPGLKRIYDYAKINASYKELAFICFVLGIVDTRDFLANFKDIGYICDRLDITVKRDTVNKKVDRRLNVNYSSYNELMAVCFELTTKGVDFGIKPLDFIYHILNHTWQRIHSKEPEYDYVIRVLSKVDLSCINTLKLDKSIIKTYSEEVAVLLPFMVKYIENKETFKSIFHMVMGYSNYKQSLLQALMITPEILVAEGVVSCEVF